MLDLAIPGLELRDDPPFDPREDGDDIVIEINLSPAQSGSPAWLWVVVVIGIGLLALLIVASFPR